jgi:hypothetical protein
LDLVYKDIFNQRGNKAGFSGAFVAAYADPYYKGQLDSSSKVLICDLPAAIIAEMQRRLQVYGHNILSIT